MSNLYRVITGYCNGYFGDNWDDMLIILEGECWVVARYLDRDRVLVADFDSKEEKNRLIELWTNSERDDY